MLLSVLFTWTDYPFRLCTAEVLLDATETERHRECSH